MNASTLIVVTLVAGAQHLPEPSGVAATKVAAIPPAFAPTVMPTHSPDAGKWAWLAGSVVGVTAGSVSGWAVSRDSGVGWGIATGVGVGATSALLTMVMTYVLLE